MENNIPKILFIFLCTGMIALWSHSVRRQPDEIQLLIQRKEKSSKESFFMRFIKHPTQVGAIAESSEWLAQAISTCIKQNTHNSGQGRRILEVGAGTGVFTHEIIAHMTQDDNLDVIEYDPVFCEELQEKFGHLTNVHIHCCSITDYAVQEPYDYVISGLPFNAFTSAFVEKILAVYETMIKKEGTIAYFEYIALPTIKMLGLTVGAIFSDDIQKKKDDFNQTLDLLKTFRDRFEVIKEDSVGLNLPPARVITCEGYRPQ